MVGRNPDHIVSEVMRLLADPAALERMRRPAQPYGEGNASERIANITAEYLGAVRPAAAAAA